MTPLTFRSDFDVDLIDHMGGDKRFVQAAKVSTRGSHIEEETKGFIDNGDMAGLINFLMKNRHGSPFEHVVFTFYVSTMIAVWREIMRHRMASYNEESGRYKVLDPVFYLPPPERPLIQVGKPGHYTFEPGTESQYSRLITRSKKAARFAYATYQWSLDDGIAKEVARFDLPVRIFSTAYVTMNARGLMNFLSLRVKSDDSTYPSFPMWEINQVANEMEAFFQQIAPVTHAAFVKNGRVSP
jgi:thymidylate synthase (FAD)